jgi:Ca2+/Na+ antiporter
MAVADVVTGVAGSIAGVAGVAAVVVAGVVAGSVAGVVIVATVSVFSSPSAVSDAIVSVVAVAELYAAPDAALVTPARASSSFDIVVSTPPCVRVHFIQLAAAVALDKIIRAPKAPINRRPFTARAPSCYKASLNL